MNRKNSGSDWAGLFSAIKIGVVVIVAGVALYLMDESASVHRDPQYIHLEFLADEAITANNNVVLAMETSSPNSGGVSPIQAQKCVNQAFDRLASAAAHTPAKFVSRRVRQMLKDGPRKLIELQEESTNMAFDGIIRH